GQVRFALECARVDTCAERIWESMAPGEVAAADAAARDRVEDRAAMFEQRFVGRWAVAGNVWGGIRTFDNVTTAGARVGLRRWIDPYILLGALLEYERAFFPAARTQLAASLRVELATWLNWCDRHWNLPEASTYLFVAPAVDFGLPLRGGARAGVGVQVVR